MSQTLTEIAQQLKDNNKKVQLIYAFNGVGKTRLSREFKTEVINDGDDAKEEGVLTRHKILYYNALTEDLFYWDNDSEVDVEPKLKIQPNTFTDWVLKDQGQDRNIIDNFQRFTGSKVEPVFDVNENSVRFMLPDQGVDFPLQFPVDFGGRKNIKISKGEESNFVWSLFYTLIEQVIAVRNVPEPEERETNQFDQLEYIFIDDPVSSLDENHLIQLAVSLALLIKSSDYINGQGLKFIITTHNPLFYNVLHNELGLSKKGKKEGCYLLEKLEDGRFILDVKYGDSNKSFSYHLYLKQTIEQAIEAKHIQRYHFMLLRNLYEKTASFLGYPKWSELLPDDKEIYLNRIIQFTSHSTLSNETVTEPSEPEKNTVALLFNHLVSNYGYWQQGEQNG